MVKENKTEDIGLVMGSKDMAMWTTTRDNLKVMMENMEKEMKVNKAFLSRANAELRLAKDAWERK